MNSRRFLPWAVLFGLLSGCAAVQTSGPGGGGVFEAAKGGDAPRLRSLLAEHGDPNALGRACPEAPQKGTALMGAAAAGQTETVRVLLSAGADPNRQIAKTMQWPCNGYTALILAVKGGYADVVKVLLAGGADTRLLGGRWGGRSAADWAQKAGRPDIVELIARAGAMTAEERKALLGPALAAGPAEPGAPAAPSAPKTGMSAFSAMRQPSSAPEPAPAQASESAPAPEPQPEAKPEPKPEEKPRPLSPSERKALDSQL